MACTPFDAFRIATEHLDRDIYQRASWQDVWINLINRGTRPKGIGLTRSTFTIGRSEPTTDEPEFEAVSVTDGETYTGACGTTYNDVEVGFTEHTFSPEKFGWKGIIVCQDDLMIAHRMDDFLMKYVPAMTKNTRKTIGNRMAAIYTHYVPKAVVGTSMTFDTGGTGAPPASPVIELDKATCYLDQEHLDYTAAVLNEEGAMEPDTNGWITLGEDGPIYPLYIGQEASAQILVQNSDLRQDRRDADSGLGNAAMLFKRIGATKVIKNFRHVINLFPPRYTYNDGTGRYTRVPTWLMSATTKGKRGVINPAWRAADYEGLYVLTPWVFQSDIMQPQSTVGDMNWSSKSYVGEWEFITGGREICEDDTYDPRKKLGRHFAEFWHDPKPMYPEYGRSIVFKRCLSQQFPCTACS